MLEIGGYGHIGEHGNLSGIGANAGKRDDVAEEFRVGGTSLCLERRQLKVVPATVTKEGMDVNEIISGSNHYSRRRQCIEGLRRLH